MEKIQLLPVIFGFISLFIILPVNSLQAQEKLPADHSYKPLTLKLNDDGSKYVRFILWHQMWLETSNLSDKGVKKDLNFSIRRSRFLAYAQVSPRFLILTHFGLNNLNSSNLSKLGNDNDAPQLFLHDAWTEFRVSDQLYLGGGLHYWNGLTRLASQSTLNFMALDQSRPFVHWHSLGYTDQFARHLGIYAKGQIARFEYRLAWNQAGKNGFEAGTIGEEQRVIYNGVNLPDKAGHAVGQHLVEGYVCYNVWDRESNKLPYYAGSYLGSKKVLNAGAGFFSHPNGAYNGANSKHVDVNHFAADAFLDMPAGQSGSVTAYASYIHFNYGKDWVGKWSGTGSNFYLHAGYYFKTLKLMPYVAFNSGHYDGNKTLDRSTTNALDIGANYFINGHNAKLTLEYHGIRPAGNKDLHGRYPADISQIRLQAAIFL
jgi:hypothetical protein